MEGNRALNYILGLLVALALSVGLVFIMAIIISNVGVSTAFIKPINQAIKAVALFIGAFIALKGDKGLIKGCVFGVIYAVVSGALFSLISGNFSFDIQMIFDILICALVGALVGILKVNAVNK